ncbi:hypothetical protein ACFYTQ_34055 [Nocardia sp. NPDC004068]|uniref:hypothetical protein n=1 Tax=Nocardia sp. NPDC004068 TaxID=3364303 RepID=UPI00369022A2
MTEPKIPVWEYNSRIAAADDAEKDAVRAELYASPFRVRMYNGGEMTATIDNARAILGLDDPDQVLEIFQAFEAAGGLAWDPEAHVHIELMPAAEYTKLAKRPDSLPKEPPTDFDGQPKEMFYRTQS